MIQICANGLIFFRYPLFLKIFSHLIWIYQNALYICISKNQKNMEPTNEEIEEVQDLLNEDEIVSENEDAEAIEIESPDVELDPQTIARIRALFDSGNTRTTIASVLKLSRQDVIEVLANYVLRKKINGTKTQVVDFKFDATGKKRIEIGDSKNTSIYVSVKKTPEQVQAIITKWRKLLDNE